MDTTTEQFLARLSAFDGSDEAALNIGRWVAISRPDIAFAGTTEQVACAEQIERDYYKVGDGDLAVGMLAATITQAAANLIPDA